MLQNHLQDHILVSGPNFQYDFRTSWGDDIDNLFDISSAGLPRGMVNRTGYPDNHKLGKDELANAVTNELNKEINFGIMINLAIIILVLQLKF